MEPTMMVNQVVLWAADGERCEVVSNVNGQYTRCQNTAVYRVCEFPCEGACCVLVCGECYRECGLCETT